MIKDQITKITANVIFAITVLFYPLILTIAVAYHISEYFKKTSKKSIAGDVAVVTGAAGGLGKEICLQLAQQGCHIAVVDINVEDAKKTAALICESFNVKAKSYMVDVTSFEQIKALNDSIAQDLGKPATILVNNAGCMLFSNINNPDHCEVQRMINVNMTSHYWTIDAFLPNMRAAKKGHIVAISSIAGLVPLMFNTEYSGTKFGVRGLMRALRLQLKFQKLDNIKTTTVFPIFLKTNVDVRNLVENSSMNDIYPLIPGKEAGKRIVQGMVFNEENIYLPEFFGIAYRLLDFLPTNFQEWALLYLIGSRIPANITAEHSYQ